MKYEGVTLLVGAVLVLASDQSCAQNWSCPEFVAQGEHYSLASASPSLVCGPGDTFWLFHTVVPRTWFNEGYLNAGDSWGGPTSLSQPESVYVCLCTARAWLDPQGRIWLGWTGGYSDPGPSGGWGAILTALHDSANWHQQETAHVSNGFYPSGVSFARDGQGGIFMSYEAVREAGTTSMTAACYLEWLGDAWSSSRDIGRADLGIFKRSISMTPSPDSGLWAALCNTVSRPHLDAVEIYRLPDTSLSPRFGFAVPSPTAPATATDSSGRVWVLYWDDSYLRWVAIEHEALVDSGILFSSGPGGSPILTVDRNGVIWAAWTSDGSLLASYYRGWAWTAPEVVSESASAPVGIVSDGRAVVYVAFSTAHGDTENLYVTRRLAPAGTEAEERRPLASPATAICTANPCVEDGRLRFSLTSGARVELALRDVSGRTVALPIRGVFSPGEHEVVWDARGLPCGVYVVQFSAAGHFAVRKLVIAR